MEWWVRCNSCGYYPSPLSTSLSLLLTSCGHLVCSKCLETAPRSTAEAAVVCQVCKEPCKTIKLGPDAQPGSDITYYFSDVLSQLKKIEHTMQFQNTHYRMRIEADKRERLLAEIVEAQRQEKELSVIEERITSSQVNELLQALREKWGKYLTAEPKQVGQTPSLHGRHGTHGHTSPMDTQMSIQTPRTAVSLRPSMSVPPNKYRSLAGQSYPMQGASPMASTTTQRAPPPGILTPPTSVTRSRAPLSCDQRVRANLMTQAQMQHWAQQSTTGGKSPMFAPGVLNQAQSRLAYGSVMQLQQHPLSSVQSRSTQSAYSSPAVHVRGLGASVSGMQTMQMRRNMAVGIQQAPGASLSQSMEF